MAQGVDSEYYRKATTPGEKGTSKLPQASLFRVLQHQEGLGVGIVASPQCV